MILNITVTEELVKTALNTIKQNLIASCKPISCHTQFIPGNYNKRSFQSYDIKCDKFAIYFSYAKYGNNTIRIFIIVDGDQVEIQNIQNDKIDTSVFVPLYHELDSLNKATIQVNKETEKALITHKALSILYNK